METWKDILGYENLYQVSDQGNVRSLEHKVKKGRGGIYSLPERKLKPAKNKFGYLYITLCKEGIRNRYFVHRLVAQAFIPNPDNLPYINHKDECKTNNRVDNLEYCNAKYNCNYGTHNEKLSKSLINNPLISQAVVCIETGITYPSIMEVYRLFGFSQGHISECCIGKRKTAYGYHWKYN